MSQAGLEICRRPKTMWKTLGLVAAGLVLTVSAAAGAVFYL